MFDDIHPEELLVTRRVLTDDEQADLRAHLARCPGCALQVALRADVARALVPTDVDYEIGARSVTRVLASARWAPPPARVLASRARAPRAPFAARAAVLVVVLGTGVAASALVLGTRGRLWNVAATTNAAEGATPASRRSRPRSLAERAEPPHAEARADLAPPVVAPATPPPAIVAPAPRARRPRATFEPEREPVAPSAALAPPTPAAPPVAPMTRPTDEAAATPPPVEHASNVFAAAERARRDGDPIEAERLYGRLAADFSGSREELIARVLRGQTLLDNLGHPGEALASFERYLRDQPNGALAEEARAGRAQALWHLDRPAEEAAAWNELLSLHPRSLHAALARSRLAALTKPSE